MSKVQFTEAELDAILASVDEFVNDAKKLAKSEDALKKDDAPPAPPAEEDQIPQEDAAPAMDAAPSPDDGGAPAMDAPPSDDGAPMDDGSMGGDIPDEGSPELSDEELIEIYGSMPPEELERHYMIMRHIMSSMEAPADDQAPPQDDMGQDPAMDSAPPSDDMGMGKSEPDAKEDDEKEEKHKEEMEKSEAKIKDLEAQLASTSETVTKLVKALSAPQRKSVQGTNQLSKSETVKSNISRDEMLEEIKRIQKEKGQSLTKSERQSINDFVINGDSREAVLKLIQ